MTVSRGPHFVHAGIRAAGHSSRRAYLRLHREVSQGIRG